MRYINLLTYLLTKNICAIFSNITVTANYTSEWNAAYNFNTEHGAAAVVKFILKENNVRVETDFVSNFQPLCVNALITRFNLTATQSSIQSLHTITIFHVSVEKPPVTGGGSNFGISHWNG